MKCENHLTFSIRRNMLHRVGKWHPLCYHNFSDQQRHARACKFISVFYYFLNSHLQPSYFKLVRRSVRKNRTRYRNINNWQQLLPLFYYDFRFNKWIWHLPGTLTFMQHTKLIFSVTVLSFSLMRRNREKLRHE